MEQRSLAEILDEHRRADRPYLEFLRSEQMSIGIYVLGAGAVDGQSPHTEDEAYVVMSGSGRLTADGETRAVAAGDVIFVAAGIDHRFHDIVDELRLIVVFAPPESG